MINTRMTTIRQHIEWGALARGEMLIKKLALISGVHIINIETVGLLYKTTVFTVCGEDDNIQHFLRLLKLNSDNT